MAKLTLSVDAAIVERAKRYAARHGTSVSRLVRDFLEALSRPAGAATKVDGEVPPVLRRLRGSLRGAKVGDYHDHLAGKYR